MGSTESVPGGARERILSAAYELFSRRGIQAVGVDAIISTSGVARQTLYRNFESKQDLVLAFLDRREAVWTKGWLRKEVEARANDPRDRLLVLFDVFDSWFRSPDYEGCSFVKVMLEHPDRDDPVNRAAIERLAVVRTYVENLAVAAGLPDPDGLARKWLILLKGAGIAASEGDLDAALRAKDIARLLLPAES